MANANLQTAYASQLGPNGTIQRGAYVYQGRSATGQTAQYYATLTIANASGGLSGAGEYLVMDPGIVQWLMSAANGSSLNADPAYQNAVRVPAFTPIAVDFKGNSTLPQPQAASAGFQVKWTLYQENPSGDTSVGTVTVTPVVFDAHYTGNVSNDVVNVMLAQGGNVGTAPSISAGGNLKVNGSSVMLG